MYLSSPSAFPLRAYHSGLSYVFGPGLLGRWKRGLQDVLLFENSFLEGFGQSPPYVADVADVPGSMIQAPTYTLYIRAGVSDAGGAPSGPTPSTLAPPTTSIGCLVTFFALSLSGQANDLQLVECAWESSSPSGMLPCLERVSGDTRKLVAARASSAHDTGDGVKCSRSRDDMDAAEEILDELFALSAPEEHAAASNGVDLALRALILSNILPGVSASLWGDAACYDVLTSSVYGGKLPWPLRWWLPRRLRGSSSQEVC